MKSLTPEIIRAEFIEKTGSLDEVAEKLSVPVDRLEAYCFSLCKAIPKILNTPNLLRNNGLKRSLPSTPH